MVEIAKSLGERNCMNEQFTRMRPPSFSRGATPLATENWIQDVEDIMTVLPCIEKQKVLFATFKLTREAKRWWRLARLIEELRSNLMVVTWSRFWELFFYRYFPATVRSAKTAKFLHLTQEQLTVQQDAARFIKLSRFGPHLALDKEKKARKFEEGLRQNFFEQVIGFLAQTFMEVVDRAAVIESGMQRGTAAQSQRPMPQGFQASSSRGPWRGDWYGGDEGQMTRHDVF
ncbi:uncharacterized protein LOC131166592 [Malania oleifera]|uniref:uncharacterized protein LOC131166592 n=1 Tax=Malania oleifera TaxID=397392 RepID=UPI0025AE86E3|nr:uncharacterized protein LOC131166592 [Malania oleifera]